MFASLIGTDTESRAYLQVAEELLQIAEKQGFTAGSEKLRVTQDQTPVSRWSLELRGPVEKKVDFLLAVTAPKVPSISPIPVKKTVSGPLFFNHCKQWLFWHLARRSRLQGIERH